MEPQVQRPEIDGLRAIAILPVVLFHVGLGCPGGFVGVDVFFVISGFLITGIILRELDAGTFSLAKFWSRRIRRIFPALIVFFAVTLLAGWVLLFPTQFASLANQMMACLGAMANFKMRSLLGWYWAPQANTIPLLHVWSLAVEEQFYFVLPVLLIVAQRWFRSRLGGLLLLALLASLALCRQMGTLDYTFNFYLLPTRAWELLIGCVGARLIQQGFAMPKVVAKWAGSLGVAMILYSVFFPGNSQFWPNLWALVPTVGTLLVLLTPEAEGKSFLSVRVLSNPTVRFIGLISYSLYLWHWPIVVFLHTCKTASEITLLDRWLVVAASIALAAASWRYVEQPFRSGAHSLNVNTKTLLIGAATAWTLLMGVSIWASATHGFEGLFAARMPTHVARVIFPPREAAANKDFDATDCLSSGGLGINDGEMAPRCIVLGDSHASALGPVIEALSQSYNVPCAMLTQNGMPGFFAGSNTWVGGDHHNDKQRRDEIIKDYIRRWKPALVIIAGRWVWQMDIWGRDKTNSSAALEKACRDTTDWLTARGARVVILSEVPVLPLADAPENGPAIWRIMRTNGNVLPVFSETPWIFDLRQSTTALLRRAANTNVVVIDTSLLFENPDGSIRYFNDSGGFYRDSNHLNRLGVMQLRPLLEPFFQDLAKIR